MLPSSDSDSLRESVRDQDMSVCGSPVYDVVILVLESRLLMWVNM